MALLVFVGLNGYHGISSYQWQRDGCDLPSECYPLPYTRITAGTYLCTVTIAEPQLKASKEFLVEGN